MGEVLTFEEIPVEIGGYLMLAAGLRLGVLPPNQPHLKESSIRRGLGTVVRFVPSAASVVLLVRVAHVEVIGVWFIAFMVMGSLSAILSAIAWVRADNELQGRPYWILGMSALVLISSVQGLSDASTSWGLAMLFSGAVLFLITASNRWLQILPILGFIGMSALPFTPSWEGSVIFSVTPWPSRIIVYLALALMLVGYLRHAQNQSQLRDDLERWMWLVYPLGLALLPLTHFGLVYLKGLGFREISLQTPGWWGGIVSLGLVGIVIYLNRRYSVIAFRVTNRFSSIFEWVYRFFWWLYGVLSRVFYIATRMLEGEGSVLWALLILIMLIVTINFWGSTDGIEF
jgi:hypothetical protein